MLSDLHLLDLNQQQLMWKQIQPRLLPIGIHSNSSTAGASNGTNSKPALLSLAGHCGGVDKSGHVVFWGGYRRNDLKEPQLVIQVLEQGVKPPTADAAQLAGGMASPLMLALQHVRQQLARLVRQHHPQQVQTVAACKASVTGRCAQMGLDCAAMACCGPAPQRSVTLCQSTAAGCGNSESGCVGQHNCDILHKMHRAH
eukprot:GHUV01036065.1.p1 GENE.GHUV01036065.1~~GHUV01036065.1.p1  ORF type:complete len:199 (-),score=39.31 GHUV01036065.1:98-694(-)